MFTCQRIAGKWKRSQCVTDKSIFTPDLGIWLPLSKSHGWKMGNWTKAGFYYERRKEKWLLGYQLLYLITLLALESISSDISINFLLFIADIFFPVSLLSALLYHLILIDSVVDSLWLYFGLVSFSSLCKSLLLLFSITDTFIVIRIINLTGLISAIWFFYLLFFFGTLPPFCHPFVAFYLKKFKHM